MTVSHGNFSYKFACSEPRNRLQLRMSTQNFRVVLKGIRAFWDTQVMMSGVISLQYAQTCEST